MGSTAIIWDERYLAHDTGPYHPERPERLTAIREVLGEGLVRLTPTPATDEEILRVHTRDVLDAVKDSAHFENYQFDADTQAGPLSAQAAFLAAGGVLTATRAVMKSDCSNAFAFPRPPGHHAEADHAMGFCLFNNVAIAAEDLVKAHGLSRVAIVDFDVHHGNGTQHTFYNRKDVDYISLHRYPFYPGTGSAKETGIGDGKGFTLNVPLPAMTGDEVYQKSFADLVIPHLLEFKPEFLLVSAGFDAHNLDPLGGMRVTKTGFAQMARDLMQVAKATCGGKIVFVLEGGYDLQGLQEGVTAVLHEMT